MLPDKLSTDLSSLGPGENRAALVVEMVFDRDGFLAGSDVYPAMARNRAKLAYDSVAGWLDGSGPMPSPIGAVGGLAETIRLQDDLARKLKARRHRQGALDFETIEARSVFDGDVLRDLVPDTRNRAKDLIEEFMIAANSVTASYLTDRRFPALRRIVRVPKYWDRIVEVAAERGASLPEKPDAAALQQFLAAARASDPDGFPDLSLCIIKLLGRGEYVLQTGANAEIGHFGLAVRRYAHSTAPNRRYPDLITLRLLKEAIAGRPPPYGNDELEFLAAHCTERENAAKKVERQVEKSAAALLLESQAGRRFAAIVTGVTEHGTWVRLAQPPVEGKLIGGFERRKVGDRLHVELVHADVERGHIDLKAAE
jgi:exoribonuclease-2